MTIDEGTIREKLKAASPVTENNFRHYAVLIPLIRKEDGIHVLYEVRAEDMDRQPGEICFPGGEVEEGESFARCALREAEEEIALPQDRVEILEELTTIYGVGRFAMHCFPGFIDGGVLDELEPSDAEVGRIFTVSLDDLMAAEVEMYRAKLIQEGPEDFPYERVTGGKDYPWSRVTSPVPVIEVDGWAIWGLTGRVTKVMLDALKRGAEERR